MFGKLFLRDIALVAVVVAAWWAGWSLSVANGPLADFLGVVLGFGAGAVAFVAHEWGHLCGAWIVGAHVAAPRRLSSAYLFSFDSKRNSQMQFLVMSLSGFAVTGLAIYVAYGLLPPEALATRVARGLVVFSASLTLFLEVPLLTLSLLKGSILAQAEVFPVSQRSPGAS